MFPNSTKEIKNISVNQLKPTIPKIERTLNNINEERDSPDEIINFTNKKIPFKSKFDKKGSDEFLSTKEVALCDVILDDKIEEDDENEYNDISFMDKFSFNRVNTLKDDEKTSHRRSKILFSENLYNFDPMEKNKEKKTDKNFKN